MNPALMHQNVATAIATKDGYAQTACQVVVRKHLHNCGMQIKNKASLVKQTKWAAEAESVGWTWVSQIDYAKSICVHNLCGHSQIVWMTHIRKGFVKCEKCQTLKLEIEAQKNGWAFIRKVDGTNGLYSHNLCGNTQVLGTGHVRKGLVKCIYCQTLKLETEAKNNGWSLLEKHNKANNFYIHNFCGYVQLLNTGNMRASKISCHGCNESWYKKPSNTYLLRITIPNEITFLKFGLSKDVSVRLKQYGLPDCAEITIICAVAYKTGKEAIKHEKQIHKTIVKNKNVIRYDASTYMDVGHTECYKYSKEAEKALLDAMLEANSNS